MWEDLGCGQNVSFSHCQQHNIVIWVKYSHHVAAVFAIAVIAAAAAAAAGSIDDGNDDSKVNAAIK